MIEIKNVSKTYGLLKVLIFKVSLSIEKGHLSMIGPSGLWNQRILRISDGFFAPE